jgi:hypothetical protein
LAVEEVQGRTSADWLSRAKGAELCDGRRTRYQLDWLAVSVCSLRATVLCVFVVARDGLCDKSPGAFINRSLSRRR